MKFIDILQMQPNYIGGKGRTDVEIAECETLLGTSFAPEYRDYLSKAGLACFDGRELTGICKSSRLHVVDVTNNQREQNEYISHEFYVVEELGVDGIVIWQSPDGTVYQTMPQAKPKSVGKSLADFYK